MRFLQRACELLFGVCITTLVGFWAVKGLRPSENGIQAILVGVLGVTGLLSGFLEWRLRRARGSPNADLELVRADVHAGTDDDKFPVLDITVSNRGAVSGVIHEFHVWDVEIFRFGLNGRAMPGLVASWRYSIDLDGDGPQTFHLSQVVGPGDSDRFEVQVGTTNQEALPGVFLYLFRAALIIGGRHQELSLGSFLVKMPLPRRILGFHGVSPTRQDVVDQMARARALGDRIATGVVVQAEARDVLDEVLAEGEKL